MPEVRLIDANALKVHMCNMCDDGERECKGDESCALLVWVNDMPTIEAEPVRHGRWIKSDVYTFKKCSECGAIWDAALCENIFFIYCPRCGSKNGGAENG